MIGAGVKNTAVAADRACASVIRCWPRRSSPAPPPRSATWRRSAATSCSAPAALFLRRCRALQQAHAGRRAAMRSTASTATTRSSAPRRACVATHPSDMCVALAALDADRDVSKGRNGSRDDSADRSSPPARRHAGDRDRAGAGRADHRGDMPPNCRSPRARPIARCATAPAMPSRWSRSPPALDMADGDRDQGCRASRSAASRTSRGAPDARRAALAGGRRPRRPSARRPRRSSPRPQPLRDNAFKIELAKRVIADTLLKLARIGGDAR